MTRRITLLDEAAGPVGEVGADLLRAGFYEEAGPSHLVLKGDSPLIRTLMTCRRGSLVMIVELCPRCGTEWRFSVTRVEMRYEKGAWTLHVDLARSATP